ncbi:uncharacterized protein LOC142983383 [Anticarsia gemmatalis]|uniref:uncharacterized protein LOC142983383 n=1 Tax=Anticarsia gemmatalis TaxID=129554 RepID=UPI003F7595A6
MHWLHILLLSSVINTVTSSGLHLPRDLSPLHYQLTFVFDIDPKSNFSYFGVADILMKATTPTSTIVLHAESFTIEDKSIRIRSPDPITVSSTNTEDSHGFYKIHLEGKLNQSQEISVVIPFYGNMSQEPDGLVTTYESKQKLSE